MEDPLKAKAKSKARDAYKTFIHMKSAIVLSGAGPHKKQHVPQIKHRILYKGPPQSRSNLSTKIVGQNKCIPNDKAVDLAVCTGTE